MGFWNFLQLWTDLVTFCLGPCWSTGLLGVLICGSLITFWVHRGEKTKILFLKMILARFVINFCNFGTLFLFLDCDFWCNMLLFWSLLFCFREILHFWVIRKDLRFEDHPVKWIVPLFCSFGIGSLQESYIWRSTLGVRWLEYPWWRSLQLDWCYLLKISRSCAFLVRHACLLLCFFANKIYVGIHELILMHYATKLFLFVMAMLKLHA